MVNEDLYYISIVLRNALILGNFEVVEAKEADGSNLRHQMKFL